jgi:hypothetical protein
MLDRLERGRHVGPEIDILSIITDSEQPLAGHDVCQNDAQQCYGWPCAWLEYKAFGGRPIGTEKG